MGRRAEVTLPPRTDSPVCQSRHDVQGSWALQGEEPETGKTVGLKEQIVHLKQNVPNLKL